MNFGWKNPGIKELVRATHHCSFSYDSQRFTVEVSALSSETFISDNSLLPRTPYRIPFLPTESPSLSPGANFEVPFMLHANKLGEQELCLLFTFREV